MPLEFPELGNGRFQSPGGTGNYDHYDMRQRTVHACSDQLPHARAQGPSDNGAPKQDGDDDRLVSIILMLVDGVTYHYYLAT